MDRKEYERLIGIDTSKTAAGIKSLFFEKEPNAPKDLTMQLAAYMLYLLGEHPEIPCEDFYCFCSEACKYSPHLNDTQMGFDFALCEGDRDDRYISWADITKLRGKFSGDELAAYILQGSGLEPVSHMPESLSELVYRVLNPGTGEEISSVISGDGSFLAQCWLNHPQQAYAAYPIRYFDRSCMSALADIIGADYRVEDEDFYPDRERKNLFCHFPSMNAYKYRRAYERILKNDEGLTDEALENSSFEWWYTASLLSLLENDGKLACVMNASCLSSKKDAKARKLFIEKGLVEQVIILPEKLYADKRRRLALVVFSRENRKVLFKDAVQKAVPSRIRGRKLEVITEEDISDITDDSFGVYLTLEKLAENSYSLDSVNNFKQTDIVTDLPVIQLSEVMVKMFRGTQLSMTELLSDKETDYVLIMASDIQDGVAAGPFERYINYSYASKVAGFEIHNGDILIGRSGYAPKEGGSAPAHFDIAVFEDDGESKKIASGGLYILRPKQRDIRISYYIKAYLESQAGQTTISAKSSKPNSTGYDSEFRGGRNIPLRVFKNLNIPYPPLEKLTEIGSACRELSVKILNAKKEISEDLKEISNLIAEQAKIKEEV